MPRPIPIRIAVAGLGRMGSRHAQSLAFKTPGANLVAVTDADPRKKDWVAQNLPSETVWEDSYEDLLNLEGGVDLVWLATPTSLHTEQCIKAIQKDIHVFCEKPLSIDQTEANQVLEAASAKPHLFVFCGFSRRFDSSYRDAANRVHRGDIGESLVIRSQTCDQFDPNGFFVPFSAKSGGIFVDCSIHDIDLMFWFLGNGEIPKRVFGTGSCHVYPDLAKWHDADNALGLVEFWSGKIAHFWASRTMPHGHDCSTEIIGSKGKLMVNAIPRLNRLEIADGTGVRSESTPDYWERFREAFTTEVEEVVNEVRTREDVIKKDGVNAAKEFVQKRVINKEGLCWIQLDTGVKAVAIGAALQKSMKEGREIRFDEQGNEVVP